MCVYLHTPTRMHAHEIPSSQGKQCRFRRSLWKLLVTFRSCLDMSVWETARILPDFQGHSEMRLVSHGLSSSSVRLRNLFPTSSDQLPSSLSTILTHREASREKTDGRRREKTNKPTKAAVSWQAALPAPPAGSPPARLSSQGEPRGPRRAGAAPLPSSSPRPPPRPARSLPPSLSPSPASFQAAQAELSDTHKMLLGPRSC